jgi:hypothetical protein
MEGRGTGQKLSNGLAAVLDGPVTVSEVWDQDMGRMRYACEWMGLREWVSWPTVPGKAAIKKAVGVIGPRLRSRYGAVFQEPNVQSPVQLEIEACAKLLNAIYGTTYIPRAWLEIDQQDDDGDIPFRRG